MSTHLVSMTTRANGGKDFNMIRPTSDQEMQLAELRIEFEKSFGVDQKNRNAEQWRNLVRVYGMEQVCGIEKMNEEEVIKHMVFNG